MRAGTDRRTDAQTGKKHNASGHITLGGDKIIKINLFLYYLKPFIIILIILL